MLTRANPQAFIDLMMEQLGSDRQARYTGEYPRSRKLEDSSFEVDALLDILVDEREKSLIHFEWQAYYTNTMPERLLRYSVLVRCELDRPVLSCVWHMLNDTRIKLSPLYWTEPITGKVVEYHYVVIEMADFLPEEIFGRGEAVLLPFVPLTEGGATRAYVQRMLEELSGAGHEELAFVGFALARSVFTKAHNDDDYAWLVERYGAMNSMIHDLLDEDPVYLAIKQKGLQEGLQQGWQKAAITLVVASFPDLETLARTRISAVGNQKRLEQLILDLHLCHTREQMERLLLSLGK
jgi:predicted transposase YdaD